MAGNKKKTLKEVEMEKKSRQAEESDNDQESLIEMKKLKDTEVNALKGKLLEVRRVGAHPVFVEITRSDSVEKALEKADVPTEDNELKVEGLKEGTTKWVALTLKSVVFPYGRIAVTTKVKGSF